MPSGPDCTVDRTIKVSQETVDRASHGPVNGTYLMYLVAVNWPELKLTEEQQIANAIAWAAGRHIPFPDPSFITIEIPWATPQEVI